MITQLCNLKHGDEVIYYTGELARDCILTNPLSVKDEIVLIRDTARSLYDRGRVELFQKKKFTQALNCHDFHYYARGKRIAEV